MHTTLHEAVARGNPEEVRALLDAGGVDVNLEDDRGVTPLFAAARQGNLDIIEALLSKGADVNKACSGGVTPLYRAADQGNLEIVKRLLEVDGIDANKACSDGITPLFAAVLLGRSNIVERLLEVDGIDANKAGDKGTPLYMAVLLGRSNIVKRLLEVDGIDVNKAVHRGTPLYLAALQGNLDIIEALLSNGADVNKAGDRGTPLFEAILHEHSNIVERLLEVDGVDVHKDCPLYIAATQGHSEIVTSLLEKGANYHEARARAAIEDPSTELCLKQAWLEFISKKLEEDPEFKELLDLVDLYKCPITLAPISNPIVLSTGITVESSAWDSWKESPQGALCPMTRQEVAFTCSNLLAKKMYEEISGIIEKLYLAKNTSPSMFSQTKRAILEQLGQIRCPVTNVSVESTTVPNILVKQMNERILQLLGNAPRPSAGATRSLGS